MKSYKLSEILSIVSTSITPQSNETYKLYSLPSFDNGQVPEIIKGESIKSNKFLVPNRSILFNKLNVRFKRIWKVTDSVSNKVCSTEFLPLLINENIIDFQYCYYLLNSNSLTNFLAGINSNTSGSHKRINPQTLLCIEIALPSLREQKDIVQILSNLDKKLELNRAINHNLPILDHSSTKEEVRLGS